MSIDSCSIDFYISYMIDTWFTTKLSFKTKLKSGRGHKSIDGSLGYNSFPKEIHNNDVVQDENVAPDNKKILKVVILDKNNIVNFAILIIIAMSLISFPQIFRVLLLFRLNEIDIKRTTRFWVAQKYPKMFKGAAVICILILIGYLKSISELFFDETAHSRAEFDIND